MPRGAHSTTCPCDDCLEIDQSYFDEIGKTVEQPLEHRTFLNKWSIWVEDLTREMVYDINFFYYCVAYHLRDLEALDCAQEYLSLPGIDITSTAYLMAKNLLSGNTTSPT